jgi:hypothetical protein
MTGQRWRVHGTWPLVSLPCCPASPHSLLSWPLHRSSSVTRVVPGKCYFPVKTWECHSCVSFTPCLGQRLLYSRCLFQSTGPQKIDFLWWRKCSILTLSHVAIEYWKGG